MEKEPKYNDPSFVGSDNFSEKREFHPDFEKRGKSEYTV